MRSSLIGPQSLTKAKQPQDGNYPMNEAPQLATPRLRIQLTLPTSQPTKTQPTTMTPLKLIPEIPPNPYQIHTQET